MGAAGGTSAGGLRTAGTAATWLGSPRRRCGSLQGTQGAGWVPEAVAGRGEPCGLGTLSSRGPGDQAAARGAVVPAEKGRKAARFTKRPSASRKWPGLNWRGGSPTASCPGARSSGGAPQAFPVRGGRWTDGRPVHPGGPRRGAQGGGPEAGGKAGRGLAGICWGFVLSPRGPPWCGPGSAVRGCAAEGCPPMNHPSPASYGEPWHQAPESLRPPAPSAVNERNRSGVGGLALPPWGAGSRPAGCRRLCTAARGAGG